MDKLGLILVCLGTGILLRWMKVFAANAAHTLNRFVIYVSLPATTLYFVHRFDISSLGGVSLAVPVATAWLIFLGSLGLLAGLSRLLKWDSRTTGAIVLTAGLGNTSFVGFAVLEALYGRESLPLGILIDQPGTFLVLGTLGITTAVAFAGRSLAPAEIFKRVFFFPPFLSLLVALVWRAAPMPDYVGSWLERLSLTLVPLALVAVGMELRFTAASLRRNGGPMLWGLGYKLVLAPILIYLLYAGVLGVSGRTLQVIVVEAAAAPMITAGIVAAEYDLRPELAALMVGVGIPVSLLTMLGWSYLVA